MPGLKLSVVVLLLCIAAFVLGRLSASLEEPHLKRRCGTAASRASMGLAAPAAELRRLRDTARATGNRYSEIEAYLTKHSAPIIEAALAASDERDIPVRVDDMVKLDCLMLEAGLTEMVDYNHSTRMYSLQKSGSLTATEWVYFFDLEGQRPVLSKAALWYMGL